MQVATEQVRERAALPQSTAMQEVYALAERIARSDVSVVIAGESGTGKEVMAQFIHQSSRRAEGPFIAINCAAVPENMLEAMLFGHEKGAFTGALERRLGKFEIAAGGTLLLDEITEMPLPLQAKLLRVLQQKELERLGSNKSIAIDVRVLATSNRDLSTAVRDGILREDLYFRLSVFPLRLPPLRDHLEDIDALVDVFIDRHAEGRQIRIDDEALIMLRGYGWPGNVRELENCMQRALVLCDGDVITAQHILLDDLVLDAEAQSSTLQNKLQHEEEQTLLRVLKESQGVRSTTAAKLGISERTLRHKLKKLRDRGVDIGGKSWM